MSVAEYLFHSSGGTLKSQLLLGSVFFKEKDESEVEEGKGGKEEKGEL